MIDEFFDRVHGQRTCSDAGEKQQERSFAERERWKILERFLPAGTCRVFEVGCAPGRKLVQFRRRLGYDLYGVDNSLKGVELMREEFRRQGLAPENIVHGDFFSDEFIELHRGRYDVCYSHGFLEHFESPESVMRRHAELVVPGGQVVVFVPNFRFINFLLFCSFSPHLRSIHRFEVMSDRVLDRAAQRAGLQKQFCGYCGGFTFGVFFAEYGTLRRRLLKTAKNRLMPVIDRLLFALARVGMPVDSRVWSPYVLYIGRKA